MVIRKETKINTSIESVWEVLGHDFAHPYKWASAVNHSEGQGKPIQSNQCDERSCQTVMGNISEKLTHYSDEDFHLAYIVTEGMPSFVKTASNNWQLKKIDDNQTHLQITMEFIFKGWLGTLMQPMMKLKLISLAENMLEDFTFYVENGKPHPRKIKSIKKSK